MDLAPGEVDATDPEPSQEPVAVPPPTLGAASAVSHAAHATAQPHFVPRPETEPSLDGCSLSSEWECPVCYQLFCEPVLAGCNRHTFCKNCLLKAQRTASTVKCPICRFEGQLDVDKLPEVAHLAEAVRRRDHSYDERLHSAKRERQEHIQNMVRLAERASRQFEVCGAGSDEVNGVYVAAVLPTYVGPTVYRKANTFLFIFRWRQTHWIIAELQGPYSMGDEREWLYCAPTQHPPEVPPMHGWEAQLAHGRACSPGPQVRIVRGSATLVAADGRVSLHASIVRRRDRLSHSGSGSFPPPTLSTTTFDDETRWPANGIDGDQVRCRCGPPCSVM